MPPPPVGQRFGWLVGRVAACLTSLRLMLRGCRWRSGFRLGEPAPCVRALGTLAGQDHLQCYLCLGNVHVLVYWIDVDYLLSGHWCLYHESCSKSGAVSSS